MRSVSAFRIFIFPHNIFTIRKVLWRTQVHAHCEQTFTPKVRYNFSVGLSSSARLKLQNGGDDMATTSIADKLAKLEKKIAKREKTIADETKELDKDRAEYNKI